ncbi:hypothetical protein RS030_192803 [Cryptosporidium xiaoi]|uniref:Autophagy-related protein 16 domain-containing protein n=1 Tax=Cryptosporidium xiaoi TaxID=659607 RepID=A0AAV9Y0M7_9CRYT
MEKKDWESLIIKRAIERNNPTLSDLLEIYGSYNQLKNELRIRTGGNNLHDNGLKTHVRDLSQINEEKKCYKSNKGRNALEECNSGYSPDICQGEPGDNLEPMTTNTKYLESKLLQLQQELTNSYRNKLNFDNSIHNLKERIEQLEAELAEKETVIRSLEKRVTK